MKTYSNWFRFHAVYEQNLYLIHVKNKIMRCFEWDYHALFTIDIENLLRS